MLEKDLEIDLSNEDDLDEILSYIEDEYYNAQVGVIEAEQELYDYIIGIC